MSSWVRRVALFLASVVVVLTTVLALGAPAGAVSGSCTRRYEPVNDDLNRRFNYRYYCSTYVASPVYGNVEAGRADPLDDTGYMYRSASVWVLCQLSGRLNPTISGNRNHWWLYTQGDLARVNSQGYHHGWGYLPATAVSQGGQDQPVPGVPVCPYKY